MSVLLVTTLSVATVSQISVSAISNEISQDPVVLAQQYLDNSQNSVSFTKSKSLESVIEYLKTNNFNASNVIAYTTIEIDNQFLDIPFSLDLSQDIAVNQKNFEDSKTNLITTIKQSKQDKSDPQAPIEIRLGEISLNVKQAQTINDLKLDEAKQSKSKIKISRVSFIAKSNNPEIQNFKKSNKKVEVKSTPALSKTSKTDDALNVKIINDNDIESVTTKKPNQEERAKNLYEAQKTKESIIQKNNEKFLGIKGKEDKEQKLNQQSKERKILKSNLQNKIKEGKKSSINILDVYFLGDEAKDIGLSISNLPDKDSKMSLTVDENVANGYDVERKTDNIFSNLLNIGSIQVSAFYPERTNETMYHSKAFTGYGTSWDLFNGNSNNGADIGVYTQVDGNQNQQFNLYNDNTIRIKNKCVDLKDNFRANNQKIQLNDCNNSTAQKWIYDTDSLIRLQDDKSFCIDANNGSAGQKLYLYKCASSTESFRSGQNEMVIMNRKPSTSGQCQLNSNLSINSSDCGHTLVYMARYNKYNNVIDLSTFSKWSVTDNLVNNQTTYKAPFDNNGFTGNNIHFNNTLDLPDAFNLAQNNTYNSPNGSYTFFTKSITYNQWYNTTVGGFKNGYSTGYNFFAADWCTTYAKDLWQNNNGKYFSNSYNGYWFTPTNLHSVTSSIGYYE